MPLSVRIKALKNPAVLSGIPCRGDELYIPGVSSEALFGTRFQIHQKNMSGSVLIHYIGNLIPRPRDRITGPPPIRKPGLFSGDPVCHEDIIHQCRALIPDLSVVVDFPGSRA